MWLPLSFLYELLHFGSPRDIPQALLDSAFLWDFLTRKRFQGSWYQINILVFYSLLSSERSIITFIFPDTKMDWVLLTLLGSEFVYWIQFFLRRALKEPLATKKDELLRNLLSGSSDLLGRFFWAEEDMTLWGAFLRFGEKNLMMRNLPSSSHAKMGCQ